MHKICCQLRFYAVCIHFPDIHIQPLFASKPTFARIDFLRPDGHLVNKKGTHNVKIYAEKMIFLVRKLRSYGVKEFRSLGV